MSSRDDSTRKPTRRGPLDRDLLRRLWSFLRPHLRLLAYCLATLVVVFAADLLGPYLIRLAVDGPVKQALSGDPETVTPRWHTLAWIAGAFLAISAFGAWFRYLQQMALTLLGQRVTFDVRTHLFDHLLDLKVAFYDRKPVGELVTRITSDVENLAELFASGVATVVFDLFRVVFVLGVLFFLDPLLALIVLAGAPLYAWACFRFRVHARHAYSETRTALARANAFVQESISGMRVVQLSVQEPRMAERFEGHGERLRRAWLKTVRQYAVFLPLIDLVNQAVVAVTFGASAWMIATGRITEGVFLQYWFYLRLIFQPIQDIAERYNVLQSALSSTERIVGLLATEPEAGGAAHPPRTGRVEFDRVSFSYGPGTQALRNVTFRVEPGETVAVVGATGAGKTTLAQMLLHFYRAQGGAVRVDGVDVADWSLRDLRRGIGVVPQDVFLFSDSILENVRLRDASITEARVREACQVCGVDEFVARLPDGYQSRVGERGVNLSTGQRQLIAFARVLVQDPRILILDEATSSVDSGTEALLQRAVREVVRGRTCLIIAHRLSTLREAHHILVMHHGELRERGNHRELLEKGGIYSRLYRLQFGHA